MSKYIKYSEPEKTTGPSGVIPIAVQKEESTTISSTILYIAFIIRNLFKIISVNILIINKNI